MPRMLSGVLLSSFLLAGCGPLDAIAPQFSDPHANEFFIGGDVRDQFIVAVPNVAIRLTAPNRAETLLTTTAMGRFEFGWFISTGQYTLEIVSVPDGFRIGASQPNPMSRLMQSRADHPWSPLILLDRE